ncbi:MAG: hypothetical protein ACYC5O_09455 [Anaerolineae bacterium]
MSAVPAEEREEAHRLLDLVPDEDLPTVRRMRRGLTREEDPVLAALDEAPEDDEPVSPEESAQVRRGIQEAARGDAYKRR